jgi:hypothetical protein
MIADQSFLTLNEMQVHTAVANSPLDEPLKTEALKAIDSIGPLRKLALERFEVIKALEAEIKKLKDKIR